VSRLCTNSGLALMPVSFMGTTLNADFNVCCLNRQPGGGTEIVLKYQLPGHNMEELISLRTNEDLEEFKVSTL